MEGKSQLDKDRREQGGHPRMGRSPVTTRGEVSRIALALFLEHGFDETGVDEIARACGIGRRTLFRYFASKNDLPWGDFEGLLSHMREHLAAAPTDEIPLMETLRNAVIEFNTFPEEEALFHRERMRLLLQVPSLVAHSALRYEAWRQVVAEFVGARLGQNPRSLQPQAIAWASLGLCLAAYEQWLADEVDLSGLLFEAFAGFGGAFEMLSQ